MKTLRAEVVFLVDDATDEALSTPEAARDELTSWLEGLGAEAVTVEVVKAETDGRRS